MKIRSIKQDELDQMKAQNNVDDVPITYNQIEGVLNKFNAGDLISEITKDGAGKDFFE